MFNRAQLIGNLGADPETRTLHDGVKVTNLRVATTETWRDRDSGERREKTEWHRVSVWGEGSAKYLAYAQKGTLVLIEGQIETRKYTDAAGAEKYSTQIKVESRGGGLVKILAKGIDASERQAPADTQPGPGAQTGSDHGFSADLDDEIPF